MYSYIMRRLAFGLVTVLGVSVIVFLIMRVMPGDPLMAIFGPEGMTKLTQAQRDSYMEELGLSDPLIVQYFTWIGDIAKGDLGRSFFRAESVGDMILRRGPLTAEIGSASNSAIRARMASRCGPTRGLWQISVRSTFSITPFA